MTTTMRLTSLRAHRAMRAHRGVTTTTRAESPQAAQEETRGENVSSTPAKQPRVRAPVSRYMYPSSPLSNLLAQTSPLTLMQHQIDEMMQMMGDVFGETPMEKMLEKFESQAGPGFHRAHVLAPPEMLRIRVGARRDERPSKTSFRDATRVSEMMTDRTVSNARASWRSFVRDRDRGDRGTDEIHGELRASGAHD